MIYSPLPEQLVSKAESLLSDNKGSHNLEHTQRVIRLCKEIGKKENADINILLTAALLHDIGRHIQDSSKGKICHALKGAQMAEQILKNYNYSDKQISAISHCIKTHRYRNNHIPESIEAKSLYDADKLDAIGAIGIGRAFQFAGEIGAKLHNADIDIHDTEEYSIEDTAYREYMVKLRHIHTNMLTATGKQMAEKRHLFMKIFFEEIEKENLAIL